MMQQNTVLQFHDLSPSAAAKKLRLIAEHSEKVLLTNHAKVRMRQRKITLPQIICCLKHGRIVEGPARNTRGDWEIKLEVISAGDVINGVFVLQYDITQQDYVLVVTVIRG